MALQLTQSRLKLGFRAWFCRFSILPQEGVRFYFMSFLIGCFLFVLASTFLYFSSFFLFFSSCNITCFCYLFQFFLFTFIFNSWVPEAGNLHQRHSVKVRRLVFKFIHLKVFPFFLRLVFFFFPVCCLQIFFPETFAYFQTKQWRNRRYWDALEMRPIFHNFSQTPSVLQKNYLNPEI